VRGVGFVRRVQAAAREAERGARWAQSYLGPGPGRVEVVGPAPAPIEKLQGRWRWHFILRSDSARALGAVLLALRDGFRVRGRDVRLIIDRDPVALL
ncbi:MAG: primosomal protein N', partial [Longimicrobiales bacterium]